MSYKIGDKARLINTNEIVTIKGWKRHPNDIDTLYNISFDTKKELNSAFIWVEGNQLSKIPIECNIPIKKIRESARLPKYKNGNWMDCYTSQIRLYGHDNFPTTIEESIGYELSMNSWSQKVEDNGTYIRYNTGDVLLIGLGFAMGLPKGKECHIAPRSGTFRKYGLLLTNSVGIVDDSYIGDSDEYLAMMYATRPGTVNIGDRLVQIKIEDAMTQYIFEEVEKLGNKDRGGYGSTGR